MSESQIHPTAVISDGAVIGKGCEIGPFCVIGPNVELGENNKLHSHVVIEGRTKIGSGNEIFQFASLGAVTQDLKYTEEPTYAEIGDNNTIREYVTVHRGTSPGETTSIGSGCTILAYCHIAHNCIVGDKIIMSNGATLAGHVEVADSAIIGGLTGIHQFCKIGRMSMVGGASKVVQDVLPFCIADGTPAATRIINKIGLERNGKSKETVREVLNAFKMIFRKDTPLDEAVETLKKDYPDSSEVKEMIDFIARSDRGLAR